MPQDFAKRKQGAGAKKSAAPYPQARRHPSEKPPVRGKALRVYLAGVLTGVFLSFLGYLATLPDRAGLLQENANSPQPEAEVPKPRFDFYTLLPEQTIDLGGGKEEDAETVEPAADFTKPPATTAAPEVYLLQAGSFRQKEDAERRRAELLLLGLEPMVEETSGDNGRWFRVSLGPFDSQSSMNSVRSLTTKQNIETLLLRRSGP